MQQNIIYTHYVKEIPTTDLVYLEIDSKKELTVYSVLNEKVFDHFSEEQVDTDIASQEAIKMIKLIYTEEEIESCGVTDIVLAQNENNQFCYFVYTKCIIRGMQGEYEDMIEVPISN